MNVKKQIKSFCDEKCKYLVIVDSPDFTASDGKGKVALCSIGGSKRSFGCINCCPKKYYQEEQTND